MKIVNISHYYVNPPLSGGQIRIYNLNRNLAKTYNCKIEQFSFTPALRKRTIIKNKNYNEHIIPVPFYILSAFFIYRILKVPFDFIIPSIFRFVKIPEKLRQEIESCDIIQVEHPWLFSWVYRYLKKNRIKKPVVLVEHNIEYLVYKKYADKAPPLLKPLLNLDVLKLKKQERAYWQKATKLIAVSETEKKLMNRDDVVVVPNGVDLDKFKVKSEKLSPKETSFPEAAKVIGGERTILFMGDFKWMQNVDAAEQILSKIWPIILKANINAKLLIVGRNIPQKIRLLGKKGVIFEENVLDASEVYKKVDILLAPIRIGGGTSFKILEAMASGVVVVTTDLGTGGIGAVNGIHVLVGNNENEQASQVIRLIKDNELLKELIENARRLIEERYDWKKIVDVLESVYKSA